MIVSPAMTGTSPQDAKIECMLAEFSSLRAEISARASAQPAIAGLGLSALSALLVVDSFQDATQIVPLLAILGSMIYINQGYYIGMHARYIRTKLWPDIRRAVGDNSMPSWEHWVEDRAVHRKRVFPWGITGAILDTASPLSFLAVGAIAFFRTPPQGLLAWVTYVAAVVLIFVMLAQVGVLWGREAGPGDSGDSTRES